MGETLIYTTNQWRPCGHRRVSVSATCADHDLLHEWVNATMAEYPPEGYGTEAQVIMTETGWLARVERWTHCD